MKRLLQYKKLLIVLFFGSLIFQSCEKLYNVNQELDITDDKLYSNWYEYRSAMMGIYGLQQKLVEQLLVLGELRADLLTVTKNADADLIEINNFNVSKTNKYASPTNFFKLIAACNQFIRNVKTRHPEVTDKNSAVTNFDKIYAEALTMRAWAYFNAVRIYGKVPYIHESLVNIDEIEAYVNSPGNYTDTAYIDFGKDGYSNDTIRIDTVLEKQFYDQNMVIDVFTKQLETQIKEVGVDYALENNDNTWEVSTWHTYGLDALLGHMYLTRGNYQKAVFYFNKIMINNTTGTTGARYELNNSFAYSSWPLIFYQIDNREHIYTIWFNKNNFQQNELNDFFISKYMIKPTYGAISNWEKCRRNSVIENYNDTTKVKMISLGDPGDIYRGYLSSYLCINSKGVILQDKYQEMLELKSKLDFRSSNAIMDGADTLVYKYFYGQSSIYDNDPNYIIYRAAGIHLYMAEIYVNYVMADGSTLKSNTYGIVDDGAFKGYGETVNRPQLGVRGRVGLSSNRKPTGSNNRICDDGLYTNNIIYKHDPFTNKIIGNTDYTENIKGKQEYLEEYVLNERALELAFEGERFYDLMRIAKRRNDPTFLAKKVAAKYPEGQRQQIETLLSDENNWYIHYFD